MTEILSPLVTSHPEPATAGADRNDDWDAGQSFLDFLPTAQSFAEIWTNTYRRAVLPEDLVARAKAVPGRWHFLVLSADWCIDAAHTIPVLARLAEEVPGFDLRLLDRDQHLALMDEHLSGGTARSIPVVLVLDAGLTEWAWWGSRPAPLQAWYKTEGQMMDADERYKHVRKWYIRDKGRTTLEEVIALLEHAAQDG